MPGWHEATKALQDDGRIQMVGIIQEQHGDRCDLFMQWKQMDWPIMVDSQNRLEVAVVPITLFIDEHGIIHSRPRARQASDIARLAEAFANEPSPVKPPVAPVAPDIAALKESATDGSAESTRELGVAMIDFGGPQVLDDAIGAFEKSLALAPDNGLAHFQRGVAYRKRFDSPHRQPEDFQQAVDHWSKALSINPNQYIWRRRIQQYGPRLSKPYSFYDWVVEARGDIAARGEEPVKLVAEPSGAEFARPQRSFSAEDADRAEPDAEGRIHRDERGFIAIEASVVPGSIKLGGAARVHLLLTPNASIKAHWNNEAEAMSLWLNPPEGVTVDRRWREVANAAMAVSGENRSIEFEVKAADDAAPGKLIIPAYVLYNVCEGVDGTCLYRRQDVEIAITIVKE